MADLLFKLFESLTQVMYSYTLLCEPWPLPPCHILAFRIGDDTCERRLSQYMFDTGGGGRVSGCFRSCSLRRISGDLMESLIMLLNSGLTHIVDKLALLCHI